jgi:hypothetical protein
MEIIMGADCPTENEIIEQVTERLEKIFNNVNSWLTFAEAKNASLLALNGAGVFGLVSFLNSSDYAGGQYFTLYLWMVIVFLVLGMVISLLSFSPLIFYGDLVDYNCAKEFVIDIYKQYFEIDINEDQVKKVHLDYAEEILINSRIAVKKYRFFKWALLSDLSAIFSPVLIGAAQLCYLGINKIIMIICNKYC